MLAGLGGGTTTDSAVGTHPAVVREDKSETMGEWMCLDG
jgi:hypothetical protein